MGDGVRERLAQLLRPIANLAPEWFLELNDTYRSLKRQAATVARTSMVQGTKTQSKGQFFYAINYHTEGRFDLAEAALEEAETLGEFEVIHGNKLRGKIPEETRTVTERAYHFLSNPSMLYRGLTQKQCRVYDLATQRLRAADFPVRNILGNMKSKVLVSMAPSPTGHEFSLQHPSALMPILHTGVDFNELLIDMLPDCPTETYPLSTKLGIALTAPGVVLVTGAYDLLAAMQEYHAKHSTVMETDCSAVNFFIHSKGYRSDDLIATWKTEIGLGLHNSPARKRTIERFDFETFAVRTDSRHNLVDIIERTPRRLEPREVEEITERHDATFKPEDDGLLALCRSIRLAYISSPLYPAHTVLIPHAPAQTAERFSALIKRPVEPTLAGISMAFNKYHRDLYDVVRKS